jgi:hypothetical protein
MKCRRALRIPHSVSQSEREIRQDKERERGREREGEREKEGVRVREREREREGVRDKERCRIWLVVFILNGMTGALAPFSYLVQ